MEFEPTLIQVDSVDSLNRLSAQPKKTKKQRKQEILLAKDGVNVKYRRPHSPNDHIPSDLHVLGIDAKKGRYASQLEVETLQDQFRSSKARKVEVMCSNPSLLFSDDATQINMDIGHTLDVPQKQSKRVITGPKQIINFNVVKKRPIAINTNVLESKLFSVNFDTKINQEAFQAFQYQKKLLAANAKKESGPQRDSSPLSPLRIVPQTQLISIVSTSLTPSQDNVLSPVMTNQNSQAMLVTDESPRENRVLRLKKVNPVDLQVPELPPPKFKPAEKLQLARKFQAIQQLRTERAKIYQQGFALKGKGVNTRTCSPTTEINSPPDNQVGINITSMTDMPTRVNVDMRSIPIPISTPISYNSYRVAQEVVSSREEQEPRELPNVLDPHQEAEQHQPSPVEATFTRPAPYFHREKVSIGGMLVDVFVKRFVNQFESPRVAIPVRISIDQIAAQNNEQPYKTSSLRKSNQYMPVNYHPMWDSKSVVPSKHLKSKKLLSKPRAQSILTTHAPLETIDLKQTVEAHNRSRLLKDADGRKRPLKERDGRTSQLSPVRQGSQLGQLPSLASKSELSYSLRAKEKTHKQSQISLIIRNSSNNEADKHSPNRLQLPVININADDALLPNQAFQTLVNDPLDSASLKYPDYQRTSPRNVVELQHLIRQSLERARSNNRYKEVQKIGLAPLIDPNKLFSYNQPITTRNYGLSSSNAQKKTIEGLISHLSPKRELPVRKHQRQKLPDTALSKVNMRVEQISHQLKNDISDFICQKKTLNAREEEAKTRLEKYEKKISTSLRVSIPMKGDSPDEMDSPVPWSGHRSRENFHQIF